MEDFQNDKSKREKEGKMSLPRLLSEVSQGQSEGRLWIGVQSDTGYKGGVEILDCPYGDKDKDFQNDESKRKKRGEEMRLPQNLRFFVMGILLFNVALEGLELLIVSGIIDLFIKPCQLTL